MPLPFLLAGLAAAGIGVAGHLSAQEKNELAQKVARDAQESYDEAKEVLEKEKLHMEERTRIFGKRKSDVLNSSVKQFISAYQYVKDVEWSDSAGADELKTFALQPADVLQLQEMTDIYQSTLATAGAGATAGALTSLAVSGSLPMVTGMLSTAGSALMFGEVGAAVGIAGTAASLGAALTPLSAIADPVVLFTGISSKMKAEENLEKAQTMAAQAEAAIEKMKVSQTLCKGIADRADMLDNVLKEVNEKFAYCAALLDAVVQKKRGFFKKRKLDAHSFSKEERELLAATHSLAKAVKSLLDAPIRTANGELSNEAQRTCRETTKKLPEYTKMVEGIKATNYQVPQIRVVKPSGGKTKVHICAKKADASGRLSVFRGVLAIVLGCAVLWAAHHWDVAIEYSLLLAAGSALLVMDLKTKNGIFIAAKNVMNASWALGCAGIFLEQCAQIVQWEHYIIIDVAAGAVLLVAFVLLVPPSKRRCNNIRKIMAMAAGCAFFFAVAVLLYALASIVLGAPHDIASEVIGVLLALFGFAVCTASEGPDKKSA